MKSVHLFFISLSLSCLGLIHAAPLESAVAEKPVLKHPAFNKSVNEHILSSFRNGSAPSLAEYFDKQLELFIDTEAVDFTEVRAKHAELILTTFFKKHPPQHFQYVYQGGSAHLRYVTGLYQSCGQKFSVYMLMREDGRHHFVINTLHLRKG